MASHYLKGGDAYQRLAHPYWAGQTFHVASPFTLQFIDLNLQLSGRQPQVIITLFHAGVDHLPAGDPISLSKYWLINNPQPVRDWFWFEPWGKTLCENHFWLDQPPLAPPDISFYNGAITLVNTGETAQWVDCLLHTTYHPLVDEDGKHIYFHHHSPISKGHPVNHWHSYTFRFQKGEETWTLEGIISHGSLWPPFNSGCGVTPLGSCFYCGQGPQVFDLTEWWIHCRTCLELDPDPTDWKLSHLQLRIEDTLAQAGGTLQNNFVGFARKAYEPVPYDDYDVLPSGYSLPYKLYRVRFSMAKVLLEPESYYFMRVCAFPSLLEGPHHWQFDKDDATYEEGIRLSSDDGGETWDKHFDDDYLFAAFGTPPAPPPPPPPPIANWCIIDVVQTLTSTGYKIWAVTNVPCHLYMFWTNQEPLKHDRTRIVRGLTIAAASQYCFVDWHQNEQEESGDTIFHTFIKEPWPECETRWYTFRALVNNDWSPSSAPIFKKHRLPPPFGPPETHYFYSDKHPEVTSFDGQLYSAASPRPQGWDYLHDGTVVYPSDTSVSGWIMVYCDRYTDKFYSIERAIQLFDTSSIPEGSLITDAKLRVKGTYKVEPLPWPTAGVVVVTSNPANDTFPIAADWHTFGANPLTNIILGSDYNDAGHNTFTFTEAGRAAIIAAGITKLGLREIAFDIPDIEPSWARYRRILLRWDSAATSNPLDRPRLEVTYQPPL